MGAPATRVHGFAQRWAAAGQTVRVLTGFPNHPTGKIASGYRGRWRRGFSREAYGGVSIWRVWLLPMPNRRARERILSYVSFTLAGMLATLFVGRFDVVIATSPQLLVGLIGWLYARIRGVPLVLEIRDLWPEALGASGVGRSSDAMSRSIGFLARFLYKRATKIVTVTVGMADYLVEQYGLPASKVAVVGPGVEVEHFDRASDAVPMPPELDTGARFVVLYAGTHGMAQGLEVMLGAAELLQESDPGVLFLFVGEGARKEFLVAEAGRRKLGNVRFVGQQPHEAMPAITAKAGVGLVVLRANPLFSTTLPSKLLEYMAASRPVIANVPGETSRIVEEAKAGISVPPEDAAALADAISTMRGDREAREAMGRNARAHVMKHFTREATASHFLEILREVAPGGKGGRG
jgi:glycosyltransferase involved in cell wall biosynthesis